MGIPSGLAEYLVSFHRLISAYDILYGTCHHVMDSGHAVGRRRSFIEHERGMPFATFDTAAEKILLLPNSQYFFIDFGQVKACVFGKFIHSWLCDYVV